MNSLMTSSSLKENKKINHLIRLLVRQELVQLLSQVALDLEDSYHKYLDKDLLGLQLSHKLLPIQVKLMRPEENSK